jgi:hypothetical protein
MWLIPTVMLGCSIGLAMIPGSSEAATTHTTDALNLLSGPSAHDRVVVVIPVGSLVDIISCDAEWCYLTWGNQQGYSEGRYLLDHVTDKVLPLKELKFEPTTGKAMKIEPFAVRFGKCKSQWALADLNGDGFLNAAEVAHYNSAVKSPEQAALADVDRVTQQDFITDCTATSVRE